MVSGAVEGRGSKGLGKRGGPHGPLDMEIPSAATPTLILGGLAKSGKAVKAATAVLWDGSPQMARVVATSG